MGGSHLNIVEPKQEPHDGAFSGSGRTDLEKTILISFQRNRMVLNKAFKAQVYSFLARIILSHLPTTFIGHEQYRLRTLTEEEGSV